MRKIEDFKKRLHRTFGVWRATGWVHRTKPASQRSDGKWDVSITNKQKTFKILKFTWILHDSRGQGLIFLKKPSSNGHSFIVTVVELRVTSVTVMLSNRFFFSGGGCQETRASEFSFGSEIRDRSSFDLSSLSGGFLLGVESLLLVLSLFFFEVDGALEVTLGLLTFSCDFWPSSAFVLCSLC